ncbi:MAG: hypothetical protein OXN44_13850 [Acidimicrobiaceae bacterium]|nr:hypothetical protein [Acidimicrobiaceae bacterium]
MTDDTLRAVTNVGETTIQRLRRTLSRGVPPSERATRAPIPGATLGQMHPWMSYAQFEEFDLSLFDARLQNALLRQNIRTWGELSELSDEGILMFPNIGALSVRRLHQALSACNRPMSAHSGSETSGEFAKGEPNRSAPTYFDMRASSEWTTINFDSPTLGDLLAAAVDQTLVPEAVRTEIDALFKVTLEELSGHPVAPLGKLLDELFSHARNPELLMARELSLKQPSFRELGESRQRTAEAIRRKVARDTKLVLDSLENERYRTIRWAVERLRSEFGTALPINNERVTWWKQRLDHHQFEILRWAAGYVHHKDWILNGRNALMELEDALADFIGGEWLVRAEDVIFGLDLHVRPEVVMSLLLDSGGWRDIGQGWLIRWDGAIQRKAERVLRLTCRPMTPEELIEAIGHGSVTSLKNQHKPELVRVDTQFRLALREWEYEEYEGIITEIIQRIERGGGVANKSAIIDEFTRDFGNSITSINMNLGLPIFNVIGDSVRFADTFNFHPMSPSTVKGAVQITQGWGERHTVTEDHMRGYSFGINPHIAWANGVRPQDSLVVRVNGSSKHEASVIWRITNLNGKVDIGRLRTWLEDQAIGPGASLLLCPTPTGVHVYVGEDDIQAARPAARPIAPDIAAMMEDL